MHTGDKSSLLPPEGGKRARKPAGAFRIALGGRPAKGEAGDDDGSSAKKKRRSGARKPAVAEELQTPAAKDGEAAPSSARKRQRELFPEDLAAAAADECASSRSHTPSVAVAASTATGAATTSTGAAACGADASAAASTSLCATASGAAEAADVAASLRKRKSRAKRVDEGDAKELKPRHLKGKRREEMALRQAANLEVQRAAAMAHAGGSSGDGESALARMQSCLARLLRPKARRWAMYEWCYCPLDYDYFHHDQPFSAMLQVRLPSGRREARGGRQCGWRKKSAGCGRHPSPHTAAMDRSGPAAPAAQAPHVPSPPSLRRAPARYGASRGCLASLPALPPPAHPYHRLPYHRLPTLTTACPPYHRLPALTTACPPLPPPNSRLFARGGASQEIGLGEVSHLTRLEWSCVRHLLGRPRRLSSAFLRSERGRLQEHRAGLRAQRTLQPMDEASAILGLSAPALITDGLAAEAEPSALLSEASAVNGAPAMDPRRDTAPLPVGQRVSAFHPKERQVRLLPPSSATVLCHRPLPPSSATVLGHFHAPCCASTSALCHRAWPLPRALLRLHLCLRTAHTHASHAWLTRPPRPPSHVWPSPGVAPCATPPVWQLYTGTVLTPDGDHYRVQFDQPRHGVLLVPDCQVIPLLDGSRGIDFTSPHGIGALPLSGGAFSYSLADRQTLGADGGEAPLRWPEAESLQRSMAPAPVTQPRVSADATELQMVRVSLQPPHAHHAHPPHCPPASRPPTPSLPAAFFPSLPLSPACPAPLPLSPHAMAHAGGLRSGTGALHSWPTCYACSRGFTRSTRS